MTKWLGRLGVLLIGYVVVYQGHSVKTSDTPPLEPALKSLAERVDTRGK